MSSKSKKELAVLFVLLGLLSISIFSQMAGSVHQDASRGLATRLQSARPATQPNEVVQVQLLERTIPELSGVKRNIFQFGSKAGTSQEHQPVLRIPQSQSLVPQSPALPSVHYLGFYFEKETSLRLASIVNGGRIYVGKVGQTLGGKYELLEIAVDHVILRLTDDGTLLRVPLGKGASSVVNQADLKNKQGEE